MQTTFRNGIDLDLIVRILTEIRQINHTIEWNHSKKKHNISTETSRELK